MHKIFNNVSIAHDTNFRENTLHYTSVTYRRAEK